ncbi:caspase domain-containing protein [Chaetomium sp. MPI-CAGE-AT-0009]|nr:caspase domain-containing protein [Chaetomium sp. MPI-CAGE-AT-0009]
MSERAPKKFALLIGIDHYDNLAIAHDLWGSVRDIDAAETLLKSVAAPDTIIKLTSPNPYSADRAAELVATDSSAPPTLENVVQAFDKITDEAQAGDFVYIHFSGHGFRIASKFPSFKSNALDEALALFSEQKRSWGRVVEYLRDVEMAYLLKRIADKDAMITLVLDCCHSGGAVRGGNRVRGVQIPADKLVERELIAPEATLRAAWVPSSGGNVRGASTMRHWMTSSNGIEFLAACRSNQKAQEAYPEDGCRGLMSLSLETVINSNKERASSLSFGEVYNLVEQMVTDQHDEKDGPQNVVFGGRRNRSFFGTDQIEQQCPTVTKVEELDDDKVRITLDVGTAHGVRKQDKFALYPADRAFRDILDYNAHLATCVVEEVNDFDSACSLIVDNDGEQDTPDIQSGCKAVTVRDILNRYVVSKRDVRVVPDASGGVSETDVRSIKTRIAREAGLVEIAVDAADSSSEAREPFFEVKVKPSNNFTISFKPETTGETATVKASSVDNLLKYLGHLTVFYNLFHLSDSVSGLGSGSAYGISVEKLACLPKDISPPPPRMFKSDAPPPSERGLQPFSLGGTVEVTHEDHLKIRVKNRGTKPVYVEVLDLEPSWKVSRTYPTDDTETPIQLSPNESTDFFITMTTAAAVPGSVQPVRYDRIIILGSPIDRANFHSDILPELNEADTAEPSPTRTEGNGLRGRGVSVPDWSVVRVDVRVVPRRETTRN